MAVTRKSAASVSSAKFTGITNFAVKFINPTDEQYEKIVSRKPAYSLTYEPNAEGLVGMQILVQEANTGMFMLGQFSYGKKYILKKDGTKTVYINSELQHTYLPTKDSTSVSWFGAKGRTEMWTGEESLLAIIKAMVCFNPTKENLAEIFKANGFKLSDFRKYNFKALNEFLNKPVSKEIEITNGEIGFMSLVTLNKKGYMSLRLGEPKFIQQNELIEDTVKITRYGTERITEVVEGYTDEKSGYENKPYKPEGFVSLEWQVADGNDTVETQEVAENTTTSKEVEKPVETKADDLPF